MGIAMLPRFVNLYAKGKQLTKCQKLRFWQEQTLRKQIFSYLCTF